MQVLLIVAIMLVFFATLPAIIIVDAIVWFRRGRGRSTPVTSWRAGIDPDRRTVSCRRSVSGSL